ncbi:MAG: winged helix-turn-helix transcriptional regulator [Bacillus sp. (in: firmicutes)]|nr:winged helix-turn-helix transcriptional regulator [Bacillus sp. (in: firmicutes)]
MCEIVSVLNGASSTINHHLKIMEKGKIIESRREGKFTIYHLNKEKLMHVVPYLIEEN